MGEFKEEGAPSQESFEDFKTRVREVTGMDLEDIPAGEPDDASLHKLAVRGNMFVVGYGQPEVDPETNKETFTEFRVVSLEQE